ncbi:hypothetical protein AN958_04432 [Leucoagaricus sp. SymC.cos]|nr:hypothetical protein AN958_04432 [Leucoagaricus sp. SymC.cos]
MHHTTHNIPVASKCKPAFTTLGPSHCQILILFSNSGDINFFKLVSQSNNNLKAKKSSLRILTTHVAYGGILLSTTTILSADELKIVADFISSGAKVTVMVSLPCSRSFLKIINVPFPVMPDQVMPMLNNSGLEIDLAAKPHIMCNSQHSDTATVWFDVWDS